MLGMIEGMALGKQLRLSFSLLIILLVVVSVSGYYGLSSAQSGFTSYRSLALETNLSGRMQANLLYARIGVIKYLSDSSPAIVKQYDERMDKLQGFFLEAKTKVTDRQRRQILEKSSDLLTEYDRAFKEVQGLISQRHNVVNNELNPQGKDIREQFTRLLDKLNNEQRSQELYAIAKAEEFLLLGRLYVVKYLVTNSDTDRNRAESELKEKLMRALDGTVSQYPEISPELAQIKSSVKSYLASFDKVTRIISTRNGLISAKLNPIGAEIAEQLEELKLGVKAKQDEIGPKVKGTTEFLLSLVSIISVIAVIGGIFLAIVLPRVIRKPIGGEPLEIAAVAECIANGDFTQKFDGKSESTGIYASMAAMSDNLSMAISGVVSTGHRLTEQAQLSAMIAGETQDVVSQQKDRSAQIATALNEMAYSIQEVVKLSSSSASSANDAKVSAEGGLSLIEQMVSAIERLSSTIENAMQDIKTLAQSSQNIGAVVEVIGNISEQTNLLALNAAIEAARAGEQGRGFAVVADEVRSLAKRTQDSTTEIQTMIESLQSGTNKAVASMNESSSEALNTVELSSETKESLDKILGKISVINDMNNQVAVAINEQSTVCEDINQNITFLTDSAELSEQTSNKSAAASEELKGLADQLQDIAGNFKV
ncbi:methyl-accepting chemotaxis protein [Pseudoalteromonas aurantia]|uniref:Methyl-accepting chemotaxis protein n=1 Tax=Pseudoalteromonas aurantia 208 TaxID=1314867 RepID=A0ABR9EJM7_9GAMM|nr:methyl-accepting chemotaxis protein [Pseudoalteromonas aurantia]MBE0370922.1 methyl-accepting chemotaxis protein [Pseudoalteromonas aurantia 208]